ncbi:MAG TPA: phosphodiester glycosidase family protein [Gammaproteobacteria bacterium]|nr:phosphodiester glycosidase family protein [Gammaproteobacteria bacterium]
MVFWVCAFSCSAKDTKDLIHYKVYNPTESSVIHVLTVDPKQVKIVAMRAQDIGESLVTVSNLAQKNEALAAINGGYFRIDPQTTGYGVPAGVLKINNIWHGIAYKTRGAIAWEPSSGKALIDVIQTQSQLLLQNKPWPINAMNKLVPGNQTTLLSDSYKDPIRLVNSVGILILDQRVLGVYDTGTISVPADAYFYKLGASFHAKFKTLHIGDAAIINIQIKPKRDPKAAKQWNKMPFVVGGGPLLIMKGKKNNDFAVEKLDPDFINSRHARTAIGILPDKRWVFVVAERSLLEDINGVSIPELRDFMHSLGCEYAVNLDGGSSSAMYVENHKYGSIMDQPVADAVLILPRD